MADDDSVSGAKGRVKRRFFWPECDTPLLTAGVLIKILQDVPEDAVVMVIDRDSEGHEAEFAAVRVEAETLGKKSYVIIV